MSPSPAAAGTSGAKQVAQEQADAANARAFHRTLAAARRAHRAHAPTTIELYEVST